MNKIVYRNSNTYIIFLAFLWGFLLDYDGFDPLVLLAIKFTGMIMLLVLAYIIGSKDIIEIQNKHLSIKQGKTYFTIELSKIVKMELIDFDREIILNADGAVYKFKAYGFGKKKLVKFFTEANILNQNHM